MKELNEMDPVEGGRMVDLKGFAPIKKRTPVAKHKFPYFRMRVIKNWYSNRLSLTEIFFNSLTLQQLKASADGTVYFRLLTNEKTHSLAISSADESEKNEDDVFHRKQWSQFQMTWGGSGEMVYQVFKPLITEPGIYRITGKVDKENECVIFDGATMVKEK